MYEYVIKAEYRVVYKKFSFQSLTPGGFFIILDFIKLLNLQD